MPYVEATSHATDIEFLVKDAKMINSLTFGFEPPAKPAFKEQLPLSITTGWFSKRPPTPASPPLSGPASLLMEVFK